MENNVMKNKINIAELLKDCPKGMELDCTMFEGVFLERVNENVGYPIAIKVGKTDVKHLTKEGCWNKYSNAKCVIFPKGKTTWEGFQRPFKDCDIVATKNGMFIGIIKIEHGLQRYAYVAIDSVNSLSINISYVFERLATEEEKQKLFDAIKANGYKWNAETKTLEKLVKPKFKVRDDDYELVSNKFNINTLVPFEDKVLVRNDETQRWIPAFWGYKDVDGFITTFGWSKYCIPYKGNEHLFKTNNDCDKFFKIWKDEQ